MAKTTKANVKRLIKEAENKDKGVETFTKNPSEKPEDTAIKGSTFTKNPSEKPEDTAIKGSTFTKNTPDTNKKS